MNFDYTKLPVDKAYALREKFIDTFVDTSHPLYIRYIRDLKADDVVQGEGFIVSFLWCCLRKDCDRLVDFYSAMRYLYRLENKHVFVMWDIRPREVIYPEDWPKCPVYIPECEIRMKSDEVIAVEPKELCQALLHDHHIEAHWLGDIGEFFLREDVYIFDETFTWFIATTHEEKTTHNEKRICFSNVPKIDPLVI